MASSVVSTLISQLESLKTNLPEAPAVREQLAAALREASLALETEYDTISRVTYAPIQLSAALIGVESGVFDILSKASGPVSTGELCKQTGADPVLLARFLRYWDSVHMIKQVDEDSWQASNVTKTLSIPEYASGLKIHVDSLMPCYQVLPRFLKETKYQNPEDPTKCAFQIAHNTEKPVFLWGLDKPELFHHFNLWMKAQQIHTKTWLDSFNFQDLCQNTTADTPIFVDIGGSIGHQCALLKKRLPDIPGRVILQDLPIVIQQAPEMPGVENMAFDFWNEQPIKGAVAYYFRQVLHDYPDDKCLTLLKTTIAAMDEKSVILVDDKVMPGKHAHWKSTNFDLNMMSSMASIERTEKQWSELFDKAGLKIKEWHRYIDPIGDSIMLVTRK